LLFAQAPHAPPLAPLSLVPPCDAHSLGRPAHDSGRSVRCCRCACRALRIGVECDNAWWCFGVPAARGMLYVDEERRGAEDRGSRHRDRRAPGEVSAISRSRRPLRRRQDHTRRGAAPRRPAPSDGPARPEGTTVSDDRPGRGRPATVRRPVVCSAAPRRHQSSTCSTPGYPDFTGELRAGLRAADAALFVVPATTTSTPSTVSIWEECAALGTPRAVLVTKLDAPRASLPQRWRRASGCSAATTGRRCCRCNLTGRRRP